LAQGASDSPEHKAQPRLVSWALRAAMAPRVLATFGLMLSFHEALASCGDGQCVDGADGESSALLQVREADSACPSGYTKVAGTKSHCKSAEGFLTWYSGHCCAKDSFTCVAGNVNACAPSSTFTAVAWTGTKCCVEDPTEQFVMQCVPGTDAQCGHGQFYCVNSNCICPSHSNGQGNYTNCEFRFFFTGAQCCLYEELTPYRCPGGSAHPCPYYSAASCHSGTQNSCEGNADDPDDLKGMWTGKDNCCYFAPFCYTTTAAKCKGIGTYEPGGQCCLDASLPDLDHM